MTGYFIAVEPRTPQEARELSDAFQALERKLLAIHTLGGAFVLLGAFLLIRTATAGIRRQRREALAYGVLAIASVTVGVILLSYDEVW